MVPYDIIYEEAEEINRVQGNISKSVNVIDQSLASINTKIEELIKRIDENQKDIKDIKANIGI